jgi:hypothetical protein
VLLTSIDLSAEQEYRDGLMTVSYVVRESETGMHLASRILHGLIWQALGEDEQPNWREIYGSAAFPVGSDVIREGMQAGFVNQTVQYALDQVPREMPTFLKRGEQ